MKKLYLDSNIILDFLLNRQPFAEAANDLLTAAEQSRVTLLVSSLTFITAHYVVSKTIGKAAATVALNNLFTRISTVAVDAPVISQALQSGMPDFEDAVQLFIALAARADVIVTRDPRGFPTQMITILDPLAALAQL
jgi:predicted nucleic acid-binding protein